MTRGGKHSPFDANFHFLGGNNPMMLHFLGERFEESTFSAFIAISPPDLGPDLEFKPGPSEGVFGFLGKHPTKYVYGIESVTATIR